MSFEQPEKVEPCNTASASGRPRLWFVCKTFGVTSEVWMHRQATSLARSQPAVVCYERHNAEIYGLGRIPCLIVQKGRTPNDGRWRWVHRLLTFADGNYCGAPAAERAEFRQLMGDFPPDVVLCQFGDMALRFLPIGLKHAIPVVAHFHGNDITAALKKDWYRRSLARSCNKFAAIIVVAEYQRQALVRLGARADIIHVIPCGVPVDELPPAISVKSQPCHFLAVGRMVEKKAPLNTIRAFANCLERVSEARLTLIGDGPLLAEARALCHELAIDGRVDLMGSQSSDLVKEYLKRSAVFVQHSVTAEDGDKEGWPVSIAEAMATGLPVVSTRHAGIVQQVLHGETGYLVEENDWRMMGSHMADLARDPELRERLGAAGAEYARKFFDQRVMIERLESVLVASMER